MAVLRGSLADAELHKLDEVLWYRFWRRRTDGVPCYERIPIYYVDIAVGSARCIRSDIFLLKKRGHIFQVTKKKGHIKKVAYIFYVFTEIFNRDSRNRLHSEVKLERADESRTENEHIT